jgi:hypothetical protein
MDRVYSSVDQVHGVQHIGLWIALNQDHPLNDL